MSILLLPQQSQDNAVIPNTNTPLTPLQLLTQNFQSNSVPASSTQFFQALESGSSLQVPTESLTGALARLAGTDSSSPASFEPSSDSTSSCSDDDAEDSNPDSNDDEEEVFDITEQDAGCGAPDCIATQKVCVPCCHSTQSANCHSPRPPPTSTTTNIVTTNKVLIMKTTGNLEIPPGIKTVLVEGNRKKVYVQLPNKDFKCIWTELGEICSSVPITIVNIGHTKVVVQAPKGRSIYRYKRLTIKMGESATFQALGSIWYHIY